MGFSLRSLGEPRDAFVPRSVVAPRVVGPGAAAHGRSREIAALLVWTLAVFLLLALASYPESNWVGPVGEAAARALAEAVGVVAWAVPFELLLVGVPLVFGRPSEATATRVAGDVLIVVVLSALVQVGAPGRVAFAGTHAAGGLVGELFGELARSLFSTAGSFLVGLACLGLVLIGRASFSFIALVRLVVAIATRTAALFVRSAGALAGAWRKARELEREERARKRLADEPHIELTPAVTGLTAASDDGDGDGEADEAAAAPDDVDVAEVLAETPVAPKRRRARKKKAEPKVVVEQADAEDGGEDAESEPDTDGEGAAELEDEQDAPPARRARARTRKAKAKAPAEADDAAEVEEGGEGDAEGDDAGEEASPKPGAQLRLKLGKKGAPTIVDTSAALAPEVDRRLSARAAKPRDPGPSAPSSPFALPALDLLVPSKVDPKLDLDRDALLQSAELLVKTLADYGVSGRVEDILPGPTVTTFEVSPAAGTKVSKVASLADDLALALAKKVRIVAPIPGKNRIGFELPNLRRVAVSLRDLVEDRRFQAIEAPLPVVLGRDIVGNPVYADLAAMPHVIVAGATGAGKSVGLNVMLASLLYRRSPAELRLLMIDPKVVELAPFDRIPHMLLPVVTDMKQAATALKWAVNEMERRYQLFADAGTKNITTYNAWSDRERERVATGVVKESDPPRDLARLPWIVVVVDEFADLMMQQGKDVEACVARLAQKARAAGMHVILATQRPSVDVITGMIKANFPTRVAFRVAQKVDSRTILDEQGAEHLLGAGDMLIKLNGTNETRRVQCPWVSEGEVQAVCDHLRAQGEPVYDENILKPTDEDGDAPPDDDGELDPMYDQAVQIVADTRRCSTSWLQRKLGLGYNRAARIVETMERRGLVGPANGAKDREVLIDAI